jgi:hypothetical protein
MNLTVNNLVVADGTFQHVGLERLLGAFELTFLLAAKVNPQRDGNIHWLRLDDARVKVKSGNGKQELLGNGRPVQPAYTRQGDFVRDFRASFSVVLHPHQLTKLEELRNGEDLQFELFLSGAGGVIADANRDAPVQETFWISIPKSDWASKLRQAGALDILLLEMPMPVSGGGRGERRAAEHLRAAQRHFVEGHYRACVADCREVLDVLSSPASALDLFSPEQRRAMNGLASEKWRAVADQAACLS